MNIWSLNFNSNSDSDNYAGRTSSYALLDIISETIDLMVAFSKGPTFVLGTADLFERCYCIQPNVMALLKHDVFIGVLYFLPLFAIAIVNVCLLLLTPVRHIRILTIKGGD